MWGDFRRAFVRRFPFATIYRAKNETVYIVADTNHALPGGHPAHETDQ